jgi:hypothetical protein
MTALDMLSDSVKHSHRSGHDHTKSSCCNIVYTIALRNSKSNRCLPKLPLRLLEEAAVVVEAPEDVGPKGEQASLRSYLSPTPTLLELLQPKRKRAHWWNPRPLGPHPMKVKFVGYARNQSNTILSPIVIIELAMSVPSDSERCTRKQIVLSVRYDIFV